jgi:hypothetical protein
LSLSGVVGFCTFRSQSVGFCYQPSHIGQQFASKDGVADLVDFGQGFFKLARNIREFIFWVWHKVAEASLLAP